MKKTLLAATILSVMFTSGCSMNGAGEKPFKHKNTTQEIQDAIDKLSLKAQEIASLDKTDRKMPFEISEEMWISGGITQAKEDLPEFLFQRVIYSSSGVTLPGIAEKISSMTGIQVSLASDLTAETKGGGGSSSAPTSGDATSAPASAMLRGGSVISPTGYGAPIISEKPATFASNPFTDEIRFQHNDSLESLMNLVAGRYNISWRFEKEAGKLVFYRLASKTFQVRFAGTSMAKVETKSAGEAALSKQETKMEFDSGKWKEIEDSIKGLLSQYGEANIIKATGDVVVTDTPMVIKKVSNFVRQLNDTLSSQVALDVKVYSIKLSDDDAFGFDLDNLAKTLASTSQVAISGAGPTVSDMGQVVFNKTGGGGITGSMILKALNSQGIAKQVTSSKQRGLSNQPIPVKVVEEVVYVSGETKADETSTELIGQTEITTDKIEVGFSMVMVPRVYDKNTINLQMTMELTELINLRTYPNSLIETPIVDRRLTTQRAMLNSGETLVLTGFEQTRSNKLRQGTLDKGFWLFGGGKTESKERSVLVVMITPVVNSWQVK